MAGKKIENAKLDCMKRTISQLEFQILLKLNLYKQEKCIFLIVSLFH